MTTLPLIYSNSASERPRKQGGIFALCLENKIQAGRPSDQMNRNSKSTDAKPQNNSFSLFSIPKQTAPKSNRYNRQLFNSSNSSLFVDADGLTQYKNP